MTNRAKAGLVVALGLWAWAVPAVCADPYPIDFTVYLSRQPDRMAAGIQAFLDAQYPNGTNIDDALDSLRAAGADCEPASTHTGGSRWLCAYTMPRPGLMTLIRNGFFGLLTSTRIRIALRDDGHKRIVARRVVVFLDWL